MNKGLKLITALVVVVVIAVVAIVIAGRGTGEDGGTDTGRNSEAASSATITYDGSSFSPSEVTVESGGTVRIVNESDTTIEPSSDSHPTHEANPEINFGEIAPGGTASATVGTKGNWEYHDHLNPDITGMIIVE